MTSLTKQLSFFSGEYCVVVQKKVFYRLYTSGLATVTLYIRYVLNVFSICDIQGDTDGTNICSQSTHVSIIN